jgi:hypothetical protein
LGIDTNFIINGAVTEWHFIKMICMPPKQFIEQIDKALLTIFDIKYVINNIASLLFIEAHDEQKNNFEYFYFFFMCYLII